MSDVQYKSKILQGLDPVAPAIGGLLPLTPVRWPPVRGLMRAQDTIPATSRRIVAEWSISGHTDWAQPNGTVNPANITQDYPSSTWRTLASLRAHVTPGCELVAYAVCSPSGLVEKLDGAGNWDPDGAWAEVRCGVTWSNSGSSTGPHYRSAAIPGSPSGTYTGLESAAAGGNWTNTSIVSIGRHSPPTFTSVPSVAATYSEWSDVTIAIAVRGGARVQQVVVYEQPLSHTTLNTTSGLTSVHAMPAGHGALTPGPLTKAPNGPTYQEHRHGTRRTMQVAERQSERLGPRIMQWTCRNESDASIWQQTEGNPRTFTATTFIDLLGSLSTYNYTASTVGWIVAGAHAQLHRLNDPTCIARGCFAAVPVRVRVDASRAVGNGVVRVQCGLYDWVDVDITGGRAIYTMTGYLESQVFADHASMPLVVWARVLAGGSTVSVYGCSVDFGTWA